MKEEDNVSLELQGFGFGEVHTDQSDIGIRVNDFPDIAHLRLEVRRPDFSYSCHGPVKIVTFRVGCDSERVLSWLIIFT